MDIDIEIAEYNDASLCTYVNYNYICVLCEKVISKILENANLCSKFIKCVGANYIVIFASKQYSVSIYVKSYLKRLDCHYSIYMVQEW